MKVFFNQLDYLLSIMFVTFIKWKCETWLIPKKNILYHNEYALIIDINFYEYFHLSQSFSACASNILDTLSDILVKCLRFSLINIESVSIFQAKPHMVSSSQSVVYTFLLKCFLKF